MTALPEDPNLVGGESFHTRASLFVRLASETEEERQAAWHAFDVRYRPVIARFAIRCGASRQDIDDIIQDVVAAFVGLQPRFEYDPERGRFRGYLKTLTVRAAIRRAGKNLRFQGKPLDELAEAEVAVEPFWNDVWEHELVAQALQNLRVECRDSTAFAAFERHVLFDQPADLVATELKTTVNNVYQAKRRMTSKLRTLLDRLRDD